MANNKRKRVRESKKNPKHRALSKTDRNGNLREFFRDKMRAAKRSWGVGEA